MFNLKIFIKTTVHISFVIILIFFSTLEAKNFDKFSRADNISDYFSGILLLNQSKYGESFKYLKKLEGLEKSHSVYSSKYLYSLINSGNFNLALNYAKKLEKNRKSSFETDLILGIYYLKNSKYDISNEYFLKAKKRKSRSILDNHVAESLYLWSDLENLKLEKASIELSKLDNRFENLKKIQNVFLNCFFNSKETEELFEKLTNNPKTDFSRYNFFYAKYLVSIDKTNYAKKIVSNSLEKYPRNLLLNQFITDLKRSRTPLDFDCKNKQHVTAEIVYIAANALSSQSIFPLSNFYINLSKYLNRDFIAFDTLLAENFYKIEDFKNAKKTYKKLTNYGSAFKWHSNKQISRILILEKNINKSLELLKESFNELNIKGVYEIFDYAEFLKNNDKFEESIKYYTDILNKIKKTHPLYPEVTDSRGVAFEKIGKWDEAENDLMSSLEVDPNQAYVINYLAYSWIEKGLKIQKSLQMLERANKLKSNDPYIIDSLGWALFKLKKYKEAKEYLQLALSLMPADPIVNDHFGDVLWKNGNEIQARYYWNYVLMLDNADKDLKIKIEEKLIKGL
tara:strand:- start:842 stop:2542 length:1701 start_codon:yes stop_codon:yes gene_type:complete